MSYQFSADELAEMREAQDAHMLDECVIISFTAGARNEFNEDDNPIETESAPWICGLDMRPGSRRFGAEMTVIQYDATLRLPLEAEVKETDKIRIVSRFGAQHEFPIFEVMSPIQRGPSGMRLILRKVVT